MRIAGIDYGSKRLGIAVSNDEGTIAFPRGVFMNDGQLLEQIVDLVEREDIARIVVGDARALSGAANPVTADADAFAQELAATVAVPVERTREAWSSMEAARFAPKGKSHDDSAAAAIILQRFLDVHPQE